MRLRVFSLAFLPAPARSGRTTSGPAPVPRRLSRSWQAGSRQRRQDERDRGAGGRSTTTRCSTGSRSEIDISNQTLKAAEAAYRQARASSTRRGRAISRRSPPGHRHRVRRRQRRGRAGSATSAGRHRDRWRRSPEHQLQHDRSHRRCELGPRPLGQHPPHGGKRRRQRAGERRRSGQRAALGAGTLATDYFELRAADEQAACSTPRSPRSLSPSRSRRTSMLPAWRHRPT